MTGMAAMMFCGVFTSCSHDVDFEEQARQNIQETYKQAFISRFGVPASNQKWGFGSSQYQVRTRSAVVAPTVTEKGYTFNAQMNIVANNLGDAIWNHGAKVEHFEFMNDYQSWLGSEWNDKYYTVNASVIFSDLSDDYLAQVRNVILKEIPEGGGDKANNLDRVASMDYFITTKGGPVTLTPIYHNSNSGDMISYYYYPAGSNPEVKDIKKMKKYILGNMADPDECNTNNEAFNHKTYYLVYEDENGNVSYDFPKDYEIHFLIANTWVGRGNLEVYKDGGWNEEWWTITKQNIANLPEYYGDGRLNTAIHGSGIDYWKNQGYDAATPHIAVFTIGDTNYIGFEDWTDMDFNDVIFAVTGTEGGDEIEVELDDWEEIRVIAEDLSVDQSTDFDFNDIVFDVRRYTAGLKKGTVEIILRAAGGTLPLYVDGHEVHEAFNVDQATMVNTNAKARGLNGKDDAAPVTFVVPAGHYSGTTIGDIANSISVYVIKDGTECPLTAPEGDIASKIGVDCRYEWCDEREDIDHKYSLNLEGESQSLFKYWVQDILPTNHWYRYAKESIDEYKAALKQ